MKARFICLLVCSLSLCCGTAMAQTKPASNCEDPSARVAKCVKDLSSKQKRSIDDISSKYNSELKAIKTELKTVRDNIHSLMAEKNDNREKIFPLMEREANLNLKLNKTMYQMKVELDEVLTDDQYNIMVKSDKKHNRPPVTKGK